MMPMAGDNPPGNLCDCVICTLHVRDGLESMCPGQSIVLGGENLRDANLSKFTSFDLGL